MLGNKISNIANKTTETAADASKVSGLFSGLYCKNNVDSDKFDEDCPACSLLLNAAGALVELWRIEHTKDS